MTQQELIETLSGMQRPQQKWIIAGVATLAIILFLLGIEGYIMWQRHNETEAKLHQAVTVTAQQAADINALQNLQQINQQNAAALAAYVRAAQSGQVSPNVTFVQPAPLIQEASRTIAERVNNNDPTLPPAAIQKTDRTMVVPQEVKKSDGSIDWNVGIYKVNTYRNWEWSGGYGQHGGDRYFPVQVQRNFSRDAAASYEHHFGGKSSGWEVKYTTKTDKLFGFF